MLLLIKSTKEEIKLFKKTKPKLPKVKKPRVKKEKVVKEKVVKEKKEKPKKVKYGLNLDNVNVKPLISVTESEI